MIVAAETLQRCVQCYARRSPSDFIGARGLPIKRCRACQQKYGRWSKLTHGEKLATVRSFRSDDAYSVRFVARSGNRKLGPIPVSSTARGSCPDSCALRGAGCFAEFGNTRAHWQKVPDVGLSWGEFVGRVASLPVGTLWRHNEAGDLPGPGDAIDVAALRMLVVANRGRRGFTFTHKPIINRHSSLPRLPFIPTNQERELWAKSNREAIAAAVRGGFTINLSADSTAIADELAALHVAPVAVVLPVDAPARAHKTPAGRQIVVCPAEASSLTCGTCRLCANANRQSIIGFRAHGQSKAIVSEIVRARRTA